ncbi:hypothetical protein ABPG77_005197 [Micractinium sp. CCAP 211/92]
MWRAELAAAVVLLALALSGSSTGQPIDGGGASGGSGSTSGSPGAAPGGQPGAAPSAGPPPGNGTAGPNPLDVQALLLLRNAVENWPEFSAGNNFTGWTDASPPCTWTGVTCGPAGSILTLSWQCRTCAVRAAGTLPTGLGMLSTLATLDLQSNRFYGTLPSGWGEVDTWTQLQNLYLNDNNLTGTLPQEWGQAGSMPSLLQLRIDSNRLTGTLPGNWGLEENSMRQLGVIRLSNNSLAGTMPEQWGTPGAFPQLSVLSLDSNRINGTLPTIWGASQAMQLLQELYVQNNSLTGGLPPSFGAQSGMPKLRFLFAANNPLGGTLPAQWGRNSSFPQLKTLDLNATRLWGTLPPEWGEAGSFRVLDALRLENNDLSGTIPAQWGGLRSLSRLIIRPGNERLCGPLPPGLPFRLCDERDLTCLRTPVQLAPTCGPILAPPAAEGPAPEAEPGVGGGLTGAGTGEPPPATVPPSSGGSDEPASSTGSSGGDGTNVGAIVGGVVGGAAAAALAAGLLTLLIVRRRRERRKHERRAVLAQVSGSKPSARPFISEEEELELGLGFGPPGGSGGANAAVVDPLRPPLPVSPFAVAPAREHSQTGSRATRTAPQASRGSVPSSGAAGGPHERRPSRFASLLGSSGLLPSGSGSTIFGRWCSDFRTESLELEDGAETGSPRAGAPAGGMEVMDQIAEEGPYATPLGSKKVAEDEAASVAPDGELPPGTASPGSEARGLGSNGGGSGPGRMGSSSDQLPWSDWEIRPDELEVAKRPDGSDWLLGTGGFGRVYKGLRHGVQPVAVKVIPTRGDPHSPAVLGEARREIAILRACRDVNIVQFVGAHLGPEETWLVTEYLEGGDLMRNIAAGRVSWYRRGKKIALDVARGLVFLHSRRIAHFDVKSPNVLLARDGTAKIADVGMAKVLNRDYVTGVVSTLAWSAPEMLWGAKCTEKADIYSFGIVLWEICSGEAPERGRLRDLRVPEECPAEVRQIILECLEARPSLRPSALQLVERLGRAAGAPPPGLAAQPQSPPQNASAGNPGAAAIIAQAGAAGQQEGELELAAAAAGWVQGPGGAQAERQLAVGPQAVQEEQPMPAFGEQAAAPAPRAAELFAAGAELGEPPWAGRATGSSQPGTPHESAPGAVQLEESLELAPGMPRLSAEADTAGEAVSGNEARSGEVAPAR